MKFQNPKGTRDFYPDEMAWRNWVVNAWRCVSLRNGFEQVDGPIFETLDLYKVKSGDAIVNELFHFTDRGGREMAIRPEFTPTLARMVAARANSLAKPTKWFCVPNLCRAEQPQRGRLREFWQWNVDILGSDSPVADAETILAAVDLLQELGLTSQHIRVKISHRQTVRHVLSQLGVSDERMQEAFELLDQRDKLEPEAFSQGAAKLGLDPMDVERFDQTCRMKYPSGKLAAMAEAVALSDANLLEDLQAVDEQLQAFGIGDWCEYDLGIVRGLAYYTGTVFELHEVSGAERAIAGGGRYDKLIELFGGPPTPAVGFGMGNVVLTNVLMDKGLIPEDVMPRPDAFVIGLTDAGAGRLPSVVTHLRMAGIHTRFSYKTTRNLGKLMKEADQHAARFAVILDDAVQQDTAQLKDLHTGEQRSVPIGELPDALTGPAPTHG